MSYFSGHHHYYNPDMLAVLLIGRGEHLSPRQKLPSPKDMRSADLIRERYLKF